MTCDNSENHFSPQTVALWRCVGCGAMGNAEPCLGKCTFQRFSVVASFAYADLLDHLLTLEADMTVWMPAILDFAAFATDAEVFVKDYRDLRTRARAVLSRVQSVDAAEIAAPEDSDIVWRCDFCGQIEAPQSCIGVCTRRNDEFVAAADYEALDERMRDTQSLTRSAVKVLREIAWTTPREQRWEDTRQRLARRMSEILQRSRAVEAKP